MSKIKRLMYRINEKFALKISIKGNRLQRVSSSITIAAMIIFTLFTLFSYTVLRYSYDNEKKVYEDGYLCSNYANKIKEDIWEIRLYSLIYDQSKATNINTCEKAIAYNINAYKSLHDLTDKEKNIISELEASSKRYFVKINEIINEVVNSKTIGKEEEQEVLALGNKGIEISNRLIDYANYYFNNLNNKSIEIKSITIRTIISINILMIILFGLITQSIKRISKKMDYYAFYNSVTGLPNKNYVLNTLVKEIPKVDKYSLLISLDMDNFKAVNDSRGHIAGDEFLKQAGRRFKGVINIQDCVCHIGGDEFLFLIKSVNNKNEAEKMAGKIQSVLEKPFDIEGRKIDYVTASIGIAVIPQDGNNFEALYKCADDAMYSAKVLGKNRYNFYNKSMDSEVYEKTIKKKAIEEGVKNGEFKVFYQPKVSSRGKFLGAEALVRWIKEDNRIIPPSEFIDFAENEGLIKYIGEVVIVEVCKKILEWLDKGYKDFKIAINLSSEQLINQELCDRALEIIKEFGISYEYVEFEVTETMIIKNFSVAKKNIQKIKSYGIKVTLDDFGTGYSSLNYLKNLPIDSIKIDKSFVDNLGLDDDSNFMIEMIINLSHHFGYEVVAEGVEKREQAEYLKALNCDVFQGYYFGKPMNDISFENEFLA